MTTLFDEVPAYRLETDRLVIRCYDPRDTPKVHGVVIQNREHLVPFMAWAVPEPISFERRVEVLRSSRGRFDLGQDFFYGVFLKHGDRFIGGSGLHPRLGPNAIEIGYWIDHAHTRQGYSSEVAAALAKHALVDLALDRVEIRCEPANLASNRVAEKIGFRREATLRRRAPFGEDEPRDVVIWSLFKTEMSNAKSVNWARYQAFDALDRPFTSRAFVRD